MRHSLLGNTTKQLTRSEQVNRRMLREQEDKSYEQLFILFSAKVEKIMIRVTLVFLILLISIQALLQIPYVRERLTRVELLEGKPYSSPQNYSGERS
ncbi:hypothetical protein GK047_08790 [Paenibacillus sp. SYP-B3998]|uniref:Uncharacterized protein n=1 Tax=Paenibacillus sp. SYP-B3998 TaxID=2678564 RepID=A0A6G3ZWL9_9BACL|nr:hypothetical protein [Paenibacillus sp. SYP-B3998]NEW06104.1 hypothetical protein [Paenibacillus sp. SYP-B3998]